MTAPEQPFVQVLVSGAGTYHLGVNDERACELRGAVVDLTPTVAELEGPIDVGTPLEQLCAVCFELGRGE